MNYLKKIFHFLKNPSKKAHLLFWLITLSCGFGLRYITYKELSQQDLLVSNELPGMDMEIFLNWARLMEKNDRWLSDFKISEKNEPVPVIHSTYHQAPLYPYFLALSARLFNIDLNYGKSDKLHDISIAENLQIPGRQWEGMIDDIRIYNVAHSLQQVKNQTTDGLIAHWKMDLEEKQLSDSGQHNIRGNLIGNPNPITDAAPVNFNNPASYLFDGNDYIHIPNTSRLQLKKITLSCWIKVQNFSKNYQTIIAKGDEHWRLSRNHNSNTLQFAVAQGGGWVNGTKNVNDGKWHHVMGVYDGHSLYLYVDGQLDNKSTYFAGIAQNEDYKKLFIIQLLLGLILLWPLHEILRKINDLSTARAGTFLFVFSQLSVFYELLFLRSSILAIIYMFLIHNLLLLASRKTILRGFLSGIFIGLAWACKPTIIIFIPLILFWLLWHKDRIESWKAWSLRISLLFSGIFLILFPFVSRNHVTDIPLLELNSRGGPLAYINGNSYHAFEEGTNISNPGSTQGIGYDLVDIKRKHFNDDESKDDFKKSINKLMTAIHFTLRDHYRRETLTSRFIPMQWNKIKAFLNGFETPNNSNIYIAKKYSSNINLFFITSSVVCALFVMGFVFILPHWKKPDVSLVLAFVLLYIAVTVAFFFIGRFRYPAIPLMYVIGISGIAHMLPSLKKATSRRIVLTLLVVVASIGIAWPRDVRGGIYQETFKEYQGIRLNDYHNHSISKSHLGKWGEMLNITHTGLSQKEGSRNPYLWKTFFICISNQSSFKNDDLKQKKIELCKLFWKNINKNQIHPMQNLGFNKDQLDAFFAYCIDQLYLEAKQNYKEIEMKRYARAAQQLFNLGNTKQIQQFRKQTNFLPIVSLETYNQTLGIKKGHP